MDHFSRATSQLLKADDSARFFVRDFWSVRIPEQIHPMGAKLKEETKTLNAKLRKSKINHHRNFKIFRSQLT